MSHTKRLRVRLSIIRNDREAKKQGGLSETISSQTLKIPEKNRKEFPALANERPWFCNFIEIVENNREILVCLWISEAETSGIPGRWAISRWARKFCVFFVI